MSKTATIPHTIFRAFPDVWLQLEPSVRHKGYEKGACIIQHGDEAKALWLVLSGWVKLFRQTPDGKEAILGLVTEGDIFGEAAFFAHASYPYYAEPLSEHAELLMIPSSSVSGAVKVNHDFSAHVMHILNERVAEAQSKIGQMTTLSAAQRLGCFILRLCREDGTGRKTLHLPVEKHVLATYLGMKPETFSRSLQQLQSVGVTVKGSTMEVSDIASLRNYVCGSCSESGLCETEGGIEP